jgi:hypothetical protein
VAIVALPVSLIERVVNAKYSPDGTTEQEDSGGTDAPNFRGMLKARAMDLPFPIQIAWEDTLDESVTNPQKVREATGRQIQDEADRTWNLMTTLYYKGTGRIPWRRMPKEGEFTACYIGISFYREVGGAAALHQRCSDVRRAGQGLHPEGQAGSYRDQGPTSLHGRGGRQGTDPRGAGRL